MPDFLNLSLNRTFRHFQHRKTILEKAYEYRLEINLLDKNLKPFFEKNPVPSEMVTDRIPESVAGVGKSGGKGTGKKKKGRMTPQPHVLGQLLVDFVAK